MAAAALARREVNRIILTRPAVEAGERLGFLPGDLMAKIDPYLRPLFDALHDMLDPERVAGAPRARRDRGRAAGLHARPHAQRLVRDPRRGAEHDARADEDVPHAPGLQLEDGRSRATSRRSTCPRDQRSRPRRRGRHPRRGRGHRVRALRRRGRRAPPARAADRRGLRRARRAPGARAAPGRAQARPSAPCSTSRSSRHRRRGAGGLPPARRSSGCVALALASAGIDDGHVAVEFVDAERIAELNARAPRQGRPDRRAVVPGRRRRRPRRRRAPRELGDIVICPEHTADLREAVVHGALHLTGMDHETDDGEMLALQAEILSW